MVVTVLKPKYQKAGPTVLNYRDYKNFSEHSFKQDLTDELERIRSSALNYDSFQNCFNKALDKHNPMKKNYARGNDGPSMNRALRKTVMLRSQLKNKYNKNRTVENWEAFCKQLTLCVKLFRTKKKIFTIIQIFPK